MRKDGRWLMHDITGLSTAISLRFIKMTHSPATGHAPTSLRRGIDLMRFLSLSHCLPTLFGAVKICDDAPHYGAPHAPYRMRDTQSAA